MLYDISTNSYPTYLAHHFQHLHNTPLRAIIDASNGAAGKAIKNIVNALNLPNIQLLNTTPDGTFPNHPPDTSDETNLRALVEAVQREKADFVVAFAGDGDRLALVTSSGRIVRSDVRLMIFAQDVVSRNPGADVVFDVKCSRNLTQLITKHGGRPVLWKTGHAFMKEKMAETGALLGGEFSGHMFFGERWFGFDDGMYVAARLAEILSLAGDTLDNIFEEFPELPHTNEILVSANGAQKFEVVKTLIETGDFKEAKITTLDGIRIDFPYGWGIVRASNTSANLTLRAEAQSDSELHDIKALLTRELRKIDTTLTPKW